MREIVDNIVKRIATFRGVTVHRTGHYLNDAVLLGLDTGRAQKLREWADDPLGDFAAGDNAVEPAGGYLYPAAQTEAEFSRFKVAAVGEDSFKRVG